MKPTTDKAESGATAAAVQAMLVQENAARARGERLTLVEHGINLWLWAEPPYAGGDPVCHAGELISWENAWALKSVTRDPSAHDDGPSPLAREVSTRPPTYFGLPTVLRKRRATA